MTRRMSSWRRKLLFLSIAAFSLGSNGSAFAAGAAPVDTAAEETVTEDAVPEHTVPEHTVTEDTVTEDTVTEDTVTEETVPEENVTEETVTEETVTEETVTEDAVTEAGTRELQENIGSEDLPRLAAAAESTGFFLQDGNWYYRKEDGSLARNEFLTVKGKNYFFCDDGVLLVDLGVVYYEIIGRKVTGATGYRADSNGVLFTRQGWMKDVDGNYVYTEADGTLRRNQQIVSKVAIYYVDDYGIMVTDRIISVDGIPYYFGEDGVRSLTAGWHKVGGAWYYVAAGGEVLRDTFVEDEGKTYHLEKDGKLTTKTIVSKDGKLYYATKDGSFMTEPGWVRYDGGWYYTGDDGCLLQKRLLHWTDGRIYYFGNDGRMWIRSVISMDKKLYYLESDGAVRTTSGWGKTSTGWVYSGEGGVLIQSAYYTVDGETYYFQDNGRILTKAIVKIGEDYYYLQATGAMKKNTGWICCGGNWYFFGEGGKALREQIIQKKGYAFYFDGNGIMITNTDVMYDGMYYHAGADGILSPKSGWVSEDGKWYLADRDGRLYRNEFAFVSDVKYYFNDSCAMEDSGFFLADDDLYFAAKNGKVRQKQGWLEYEGNWYYSDSNGIFLRSESIELKGVIYNFDHKGIWIPECYEYFTGYIEDSSYTTINGRRYHVDENGVVDSWFGIDVSAWNGDIDWEKVAADGVDFAFIRAGGRFIVSGGLYNDSKTRTYIEDATAAGIPVGVYFYTGAVNETEAIEEAEFVLDVIKGLPVELPVVIDTEYAEDGRHSQISRTERTKVVKAFCDTIEKAGYRSMYYASMSWAETFLDTTQLRDYMHWSAQYWTRNQCDDENMPYQIWQYSDEGSINGIKGDVDVNIWYRNYRYED